MTINWMNPGDDSLEARRIGYEEGMASVADELARLRAIEARLVETADGARLVPGVDPYWFIDSNGQLGDPSGYPSYGANFLISHPRQCYSIRAAAIAAAEKESKT